MDSLEDTERVGPSEGVDALSKVTSIRNSIATNSPGASQSAQAVRGSTGSLQRGQIQRQKGSLGVRSPPA